MKCKNKLRKDNLKNNLTQKLKQLKKHREKFEEQQEKQDGHIGDVVGELADDKRPLKENGGHGYQDDSQGFVAPCMRGQIRMDGLVEERLVVWRQQAHLGEDAEKGPDGQPEDGNELYDGIFVEIIEHLKR